MTILVTGATGTVGRHLVTQLLEKGEHVRALTRDPSRSALPSAAEVVAGDLTDLDSLRPAFSGVRAAHLITFGGEVGEDLENGEDLVYLALSEGVERISVLGGWDTTSVQAALGRSSISWSQLEPLEFMANTLEWADEVRKHRTVSSLGSLASAMVHEADIASASASVLTADGDVDPSYMLTGPEALTAPERVRILSEVLGDPIELIELTVEQERARLEAYGFGEEYVDFGLALALDPPEIAGTVLDTVERMTGRPGRTFRQWVEENAGAFAASMSRPVGGLQ